MLEIEIPGQEMWDEKKGEFYTTSTQKLQLEHSLISISKWESKWKKPFLTSDKNTEEIIDYIRCMCITQNVNPVIFYTMSKKTIEDITSYINEPMTATTFSKENNKGGKSIVTSEIIYYWMIAFNIPFECQKWHLNRLLTLVKVCQIKNEPPKKMSLSEIRSRNKALNNMRKAQLNTKG